MNFKSFDIQEYLDNKGIPYYDSGENVSQGWIGIECLFCNDQLNHLGINLLSKTFSCFKCGEKGSLLKLICEIENCGRSEALRIINLYEDQYTPFYIPPKKQLSDRVFLPKQISKNFTGIFENFLLNRGFIPNEIIKKYNLYTCHYTGDFKYRIIIPIYVNKELISFVGRDVTGKVQLSYKNAPIEQSKMSVKSVLYNIDSVKETVIIVEGITDVWRIGDGAVATFGTKYTSDQISMLNGIEKAYIMYDVDAPLEAEKLAYDVAGIVPNVEILTLEKGDPCDLSIKEVAKLRYEIFNEL